MGNRSRRQRASPNTQVLSTEAKSTQPWYKKLWLVASAVGAVAFTLGLNGPTILQNLRKMPAEVSATSDQYFSWLKEDEKWTGNWSTFPEYIVNMEDMKLSENVDLKISLISTNGEIGGEVSTGEICKNVPYFDFLMLRGKVSGKTAHVIVWDIIGGKTVEFGELDLIREDDVITVKPLSGNTKWFPAGARIGMHPTPDEGFLSNFCNRGKK
jgi:hypothetical protein